MNRAARFQRGSVVFDKRRRTWNYLWWDNGKRRSQKIGTLTEFPTKGAAQRRALSFQSEDVPVVAPETKTDCTVKELAERYEAERMPSRRCTARMYSSWLRNYIIPKWGDKHIADLQPREVELWIRELKLAPKSKAHVRGMLHLLMEFAMWSGVLKVSRNPVDLVVVRGASKRTRQPRSLTVDEFKRVSDKLLEPFRTIVLICVGCGLRISECLALKWFDIDWLNGTLRVERGIVAQRVEDAKTESSRKALTVASELLESLKLWRHETNFAEDTDWVFASSRKIGRLPYSYNCVWREIKHAAEEAGLVGVATHTFRHTYRTWLDSVGTPVGVQQRLMRHADIRTTMNVYGDAVTADMREAQQKVGKLAFQ